MCTNMVDTTETCSKYPQLPPRTFPYHNKDINPSLNSEFSKSSIPGTAVSSSEDTTADTKNKGCHSNIQGIFHKTNL